MNRVFFRLKLFFLVVFAVATAGVVVHHLYWVRPAEACEANGAWWDPEHRICARPVLISDITGRTIPERKAAEAAAEAPAAEPDAPETP